MSAFTGFYYNRQLHNYFMQFMAIFSNMHVEVGKLGDVDSRLIKVPIKASSVDRVVAAIKGENTQNKPLRLPALGAYMVNLELAPDLRKGVGQTRRQTFMPKGGLYPDSATVVEQRMPVPYRLFIELSMFTSNQDQHFQIMEQILMLFDPQLQIQTSDEPFDWTKITTVEMQGLRFEENQPMGPERRLIQSTIDFSMPVYLSIPADLHKRIVQEVFVRVAAVNRAACEVINNPRELIAELDAQGIDYDNIFSSSNITIDQP